MDEFNSRFVTGEDSEARRARTRRSTTARPQRRSRRTETNVVLIALAAIAIFTVIVIAAWKTGGSPAPAPKAAPKTHAARVPPALFTFAALHGTTHVIARNTSATGVIRYDGTVQTGDTAVAIRGKRLWVAIDSPENLHLQVRGKIVHAPGLRPRVIIIMATGWRPA